MPIFTLFISYRHGSHHCAAYKTIEGLKTAIAEYLQENDAELEKTFDFSQWNESSDYQDIYSECSDGSWITVSKTLLL